MARSKERPNASVRLCFAAERTLGRLTKWLRLLGFDTISEPAAAYERFFEKLQPDRILLTRTGRIRDKFSSHRMVFVESNDPQAQLKQVIREVEIGPGQIRPFSRCLRCNLEILEIKKDSILGQVPDYILESHDRFRYCPNCKRIYWPGSHTKRSMERIGQLFREEVMSNE
jgi:uncharacterized protein with PIN domain